MSGPIEIVVVGEPAPKGSLLAFAPKYGAPCPTCGRREQKAPFVTEKKASPSKRWQSRVHWAALTALNTLPPAPKQAPVRLEVKFLLSRGKSVTRPLPSVSPDLDKLARGLLDPLIHVLYRDDAQVTDLILRKRYADDGAPPGALITAGWKDV